MEDQASELRALMQKRMESASTHAPRSLRMTKSADGHIPGIIAYRRRQKQQAVFVGFCSIPREPAQRAGLLRGDQVGVQISVYA